MEADTPAPFVPSVLLVDDEPVNLTAVAAILDPLGVRLVTARSGPEALRAVLDEDFAVILMDVQMPGMDGFETASLIKQRRRSHNIPIIFVTAFDHGVGSVARGYREGAVDYIQKPYEAEILRAKVAVFVELEIKRARIAQEERARRKEEREALVRESERRFQGLVDAVPLSIWTTRPGGEIHYANRWWSEYSGLEPGGTRVMWSLDPLHPDDRDGVRVAWEQALREGRPFELQCRLRRRSDGAFRWHLVRVAPERSAGGAVTGWIATATDIDDQRRAEETLGRLLEHEQGARQDAESASSLKDEFLAIVSHELRTPLTVILGWAKVLRSGEKRAAEAPRAIAAIERSAIAQARLVGDLLDVSRILTGKLHLDVHSFDLRAVVMTELDALRLEAERKSIELVVDLDAIDAFVGDAGRLQQVCWNLLVNAIKFTPPRGRIEVRLRDLGGYAELTVCDTGEGIPAPFLPHIFERFRQADARMSRAHGGLGLGLALARDLVALHGGTIRAESPGEGQGALFTVTLPRQALPGPEAPPPPEPPPADLDGVKVLVVDDEADALEYIATVLEGHGAEVLVAVSVPDALATLKRAKPDVLLSDIAMPREDGYSLIRSVRSLGEEGGHIPAAALTAHAQTEVRERALAAGFQVYESKPIDPSRLAEVVAELARKSETAATPSSSPPGGLGGSRPPQREPGPAPDACAKRSCPGRIDEPLDQGAQGGDGEGLLDRPGAHVLEE
jgi:PAS domain S-box-containing protein